MTLAQLSLQDPQPHSALMRGCKPLLHGARENAEAVMGERHQNAPSEAPKGPSRGALRSATASVTVLCITVVLIVGLFLAAAWLQHGSHLVPGHLKPGQTAPGQPPRLVAGLVWEILPLIGIALAMPGMRAPRSRRALIGLIGNIAVWAALPASLIITTLLFGP